MIASVFYNLNHATLWQREIRVWERTLRAASLDRLVYLGLHRLGWMGEDEDRLLCRLIKPGMEIVDIGANIGLYSLRLAALTGETGRVYAFEPEPELFATLLRNCAANKTTNVVPFQCAVGNSNGRAALARSAFNSGNNNLAPRKAGTVEVKLVRADDVLPAVAIDFIKVDVQGYELAALAGLKGVLTSNPGIRVMFEFWPAGLYAADTEPKALLRFLVDLGFTIYSADGSNLSELADPLSLIRRLGNNGYTNLLASRTGVPTS